MQNKGIKRVVLLLCFLLIKTVGAQHDADYSRDFKKPVHLTFWSDSVIHLVWDIEQRPYAIKYILEKSIDQRTFFPIDSIVVSGDESLQAARQFPNRKILLTNEPGYWRCIYNDYYTGETAIVYRPEWNYRVREEHPRKRYYSHTASTVHFEANVNAGTPAYLKMLERATMAWKEKQLTVKKNDLQLLNACPPDIHKPPGYNEFLYAMPWEDISCGNCGVVKKMVWGKPILYQGTCGNGDCVDNCTNPDGSPIHSCAEYNQCGCAPWPGCEPIGAREAFVEQLLDAKISGITTTSKPADCGGGLGSASVTDPTVGVAPFSYQWAPSGGNGKTANNLSPGTYTVTVTDASGCNISKTVVVGGTVGTPINFSLSAPAGVCPGDIASNITVGGAIPSGATYSWNFGSGSSIVSGSGKGPYHVKWSSSGKKTISLTVGQPGGCKTTKSITIDVWSPPAPVFEAPAVCLGNKTIFNASATPVNPPISSWQWDFGDGSTSTAPTTEFHSYTSNGTYTVTLLLTNVHGCKSSISKSVLVKRAPMITTSSTSTACSQSTGTATVNASGGTGGPYTYSWIPSGQTTTTATGLSSGIYSIVTTDKNGCTVASSVNVASSSGMGGSVDIKNPTCPGDTNGKITALPTGGSQPYSYSWPSIGRTTQTITGLKAGPYPVVVTDANGCSIGATITLTEPTPMGGSLPNYDPSCYKGSNGNATAIPQGGFPPYKYLYSDGQTTAQATGLSAGVYTVTVTDSIGCKISAPFTINDPPPIKLTTVSTPTACGGVDIGTATIAASGGSGKFAYSWNDIAEQITATATGLPAGEYVVSVRDTAGCLKDTTVIVGFSPAIQPAVVTTSTNCGSGDGTATVTATGGSNSNYTFFWTPQGVTTATVSNLIAGNYSLTITDGNGCDTTVQVVIGSLGTPINATLIDSGDVTCFGDSNGFATIKAVGGNGGGYFYSWSTGGTDATETGLKAGVCLVVVTDAAGCKAKLLVKTEEPSPLRFNNDMITPICGNNKGSATIHTTGGVSPYQFLWSPSGGTDSVATGLSVGQYTVTITDKKGCDTTAIVDVKEAPPGPVLNIVKAINERCYGDSMGVIVVDGEGGSGTLMYRWQPEVSFSDSAGNLTTGNYFVTVRDSFNCMDTKEIKLISPEPLIAIVSGKDTLCPGENTTLTASAGGGTGSYNYSWSPSGEMTANLITSPAVTTNYTLTVYDENGCEADTQMVIIVENIPIHVNVVSPSGVCYGDSLYLEATTEGGKGLFTWSPGDFHDSTIKVAPLVTTVYTVTVVNACGISASNTITAVIHQLPEISFSSDVTDGCAPVCVTFKNSSVNGQSYSWDFGDNGVSDEHQPVHCYQSSGDFAVKLVVTDENGCSNSKQETGFVHVYPQAEAEFSVSQEEVSITYPEIAFTNASKDADRYQWNFGDALLSVSMEENPSFTYADTGNYRVQLIASNEHGCPDTATRLIHVKGDFTLYVPNTFTPDGDGKNDVFNVKGMGINHFEMIIYDRWGNLIFETTDLNKGWDGRANGGQQIAQIDTYVWKIQVTDNRQKQHWLIGHVNIIR